MSVILNISHKGVELAILHLYECNVSFRIYLHHYTTCVPMYVCVNVKYIEINQLNQRKIRELMDLFTMLNC